MTDVCQGVVINLGLIEYALTGLRTAVPIPSY